MNSFTRFASMCLPLAALLLTGCGHFEIIHNLEDETVTGSGVMKTETRSASGFSRIQLKAVGDVTVRQTGHESLKIEAEDNILPLLETKVVKGTLELGMKQGYNLRKHKPIRFTVEVRSLEGISLTGAGNISVANIRGAKLAAALTGSGNIRLQGKAEDLTVSLAGAGNYEGSGFSTRRAKVTLSGTGDAQVNVSEELDARVSGVGSITYAGSPKVHKSVTGVGSVKPR